MIGFLDGKVEFLQRPFLIVNVNGVGYKALVAESVYTKFSKGDKIRLYTFTYVREDALDLFGFLEAEDLSLFESLITVPGVGPKTALNIFSFGERKDIIAAIAKGDTSFFTSVPRLGTKNAQKIIIELKGKVSGDSQIDLTGKDLLQNKEVIDALKGFGFTVSEAHQALREIKEKNLTTEEMIRLSLKNLGKR